MQTDHRRNRDV